MIPDKCNEENDGHSAYDVPDLFDEKNMVIENIIHTIDKQKNTTNLMYANDVTTA